MTIHFTFPTVDAVYLFQMYIERLIITGFKSYRDHTIIDGFDPFFNAITGPNGSGKSNILDAICFVLGMRNLSQLRAGSLQELIYKSGQSGISKARVEIIFNNEDKDSSPVEYRHLDQIRVARQITAGSTSKYFISDHVTTQEKVQSLFRSVQLNVDNPHFLIMQGRIRKVLDMKPAEILGLIEEAAGIRLYKDKKDESLKILEKTQIQIDEINRIIDNDLTLKIQRLRRERKEFEEWYAMKAEIERRERWIIAFDYQECERILEHGAELTRAAEQQLAALRDSEAQTAQDLEGVRAEIAVLTERRNTSEREQLARLESELQSTETRITKAQTLKKQASAEIRRFHRKRDDLEGQLRTAEGALADRRAEFARGERRLAELQQQIEAAAQQVSALDRRINGAKAGLAGENDELSVSEQIQQQKRVIADCDVAARRIENGRPHLLSQQRGLREQIQRASRELDMLTVHRDEAARAKASAEGALATIDFDPEHERGLLNEREALLNDLNVYRDRINRAERFLVGVEFEFTAPFGVDRSEVHGVLVRLIRVRDKSYCTALEIVAGGKLYHVVVEREEAAARILKEGRLRRHVTLIPLDQIESKRIAGQVMAAAKRAARSAHLAMDLVEYERRDEPAVQFAFGQTVVCDSPDEAKALAFTRQLRLKAVTKGGDVYDPIGTLSGGGRPDGGSVIARLAEYDDLAATRAEVEERLRAVDGQLRALEGVSQRFRALREQCELASHELALAVESISQSASESARGELERVERELEESAAAKEATAERRCAAVARLRALELTQSDWDARKNTEVAQLERQLRQAQHELKLAKTEKNASEGAFEMASVEIQEMEKELASARAHIGECAAAVDKNVMLERDMGEELQAAQAARERAELELGALKRALSEATDTLAAAVAREEALQEAIRAQAQEKRRCDGKLAQYRDESRSTKQRLKAMRKKFAWILQEQRFFGLAHTDFDFKLYDPANARGELDEMVDRRQQLELRVNKRAVTMCEVAEREFDSLSSKRRTVETERAKIREIIEELEVKTREALEKTHIKVDRELCEIVKQVLPGSTAQLQSIKSENLYVGLELKVAFSNIEKGLQELSGGQRSLIALALVLALLKFKPAPFYILDEIDAALDLSHTHNIGKMLRQSFKSAQFIIVSLKEGMWNNANVVFRTSFRGSNSQVHRTVHHG